MKNDCGILNPLQRDGTSQKQRLVRALHPSYVKVDERELPDLLLYAREYASKIRYYSANNQAEGNWKIFIEGDISTYVSIIRNTSLKTQKDDFDIAISNATNQTAPFEHLFTPIFSLAKEIDNWYNHSIEGLLLHTALTKLINSLLNNSLRNTIAFALRTNEVLTLSGGSPISIPFYLAPVWNLENIQADALLFPANDLTNQDELENAIDKIQQEFQQFHDGLQSIINKAEDYLLETLENYPKHEPHMALFLAFLRIFEIAQNYLNTITRRHLNYYYREVLQLEPIPAKPDEVHIVFQLAKGFPDYFLKEDTALKAGKDENKVNMFFEADNELLINRGKLDEEDGLKSIFVEKHYPSLPINQQPGANTDYIIKNIYAATKANSADGLGAEILDEDGKWLTLGGTNMPYAEVGFAIASPLFLLKEGTREIKLSFLCELTTAWPYASGNDEENRAAQEIMGNVIPWYTGEKGWVKTHISEVKITEEQGQTLCLDLALKLSPGDEPFLNYNSTVFTEGFNTKHPVLKFIFDNKGIEASELSGQQGFSSIASIREHATLFVESVTYNAGIYAIYEGEYYEALTNTSGAIPSLNSPVWRRIGRSYPYKYFKPLKISEMDIELNVTGMQNLILENDVGTINPAKPFQPFGPIPKVGSKFFIGSHEIFKKQLKDHAEVELEIVMKWADLPEDSFKTHYTNYKPALANSFTDDAFKVTVEKLEGGQWIPLLTENTPTSEETPLFEKNIDEDGNIVDDDPPRPVDSINLTNILAEPAPNLEDFVQLTPGMTRGFIRLVLKHHFFHKYYAPSLTTYVAPPPPNRSGNAPNEPYTPVLNFVKINYRTKEKITFRDDFFEDRIEQLFHIEPFGWKEIYPYDNGIDAKVAVVNRKLIPEFLTVEPADSSENPEMTDAEGNLLIGLIDLKPPQSVSILFQVAEGSSDPDLNAQEVSWSYLSNNNWIDFETGEIISDTTNGLLTSGIITFAIPRNATNDNTKLKAGPYWIKASVARQTAAISKAIVVMPQAVKATFDLTEAHNQDRLKHALPAETVSKLKERQAAIKKVLQPFASFGGKVEEQVEAPAGIEGEERFNKEYNEYYIRISERLRHKNRGIAIFDYERVVLQEFSDIYKVKCLNHTSIARTDPYRDASEHAPGHVKLIVLPHLRNKNAIDPARPRVSLNRLEEVKAFVQPLVSDFITLEVKNPIFEEIQVDFKVKFYPLQEANRGFYENLLNEDIKRFLSPWLYESGKDLQLGGKIHRSLILNYIEERDYVDFVVDFTMNQIIEGQPTKIDIEEAIATTSSSVIVSANQHIIKHDIEIPCLTPSSS